MRAPRFLAPYREAAKIASILEVIFSRSTYQIWVEDPSKKERGWTFIQLDEEKNLRNAFCDCHSQDKQGGCVHLAAAWHKIFGGKGRALHERFTLSPWCELTWFFAEKLGFDATDLERVEKDHFVGKEKKEVVLDWEGEGVEEELFNRPIEEEENSIKFSNLSEQEISRWRDGRPSFKLRYELSFWSDLGKKMFLIQDRGEEYEISFRYSSKGIPNWIQITFPHFQIGFSLDEKGLIELIPTLSTVRSPLPVFGFREAAIQNIIFLPEKGELIIEASEKTDGIKEKKQGIQIGQWLFVPDEGFYTLQSSHQKRVLKEDAIGRFLDEFLPAARALLKETPLHEEGIEMQMGLHLSKQGELTGKAYFEVEGDSNQAQFFGDWVYREGKGFYRLLSLPWPSREFIVKKREMGTFITQYKTVLNTIPGFTIHPMSLEGEVSFRVLPNGSLFFEAPPLHERGMQEFLPWVYVKDQGFYPRSSSFKESKVQPGKIIPSPAVSPFIRENEEELRLIPGFFSSHSPIGKVGIKAFSDEEGILHIDMHYEKKEAYRDRPLVIYQEFVFSPGEGFCHLVLPSHLIGKREYPFLISEKERDIFLEEEWKELLSAALDVEPSLIPPQQLKLILKQEDKDHLRYVSEQGEVDPLFLCLVMQQGKRFALTPAGLLDLQEPRFYWMKSWVEKLHKKQKIKLSTLELLRIHAFDALSTSFEGTLRERLKQLLDFIPPSEPSLNGLKANLRPYQWTGLKWLWGLYHQGLSSLLCDEMGLGKTHQSMALMVAIQNLHQEQKKEKPRFLVACPTSVIYHWQDKLKEFTPDMKVLTFHGKERKQAIVKEDYDLLLTSYGILRRERDLIGQLSFSCAVFDEIQLGKNQESKLHAALLKVRTEMTIGLTGTPIENQLRELKSLFDIVLPTYMPNATDYRQFFVNPIERGRDFERRNLLKRFVDPFVLRRKKEDVLQDLPEKVEEITTCALLPDQARLYQETLEQSRHSILQVMEDRLSPVPYLHVFALLSRLKQICDHPAVFARSPQDYKNYSSGKWERFKELLEEARESGQKVVVYSQYLMQLDIIEQYLKEQKIGYVGLRGSTKDRGTVVKRFQTEPKTEVFVASLQAAGLGIDLTAASVVIHYDRWWNAARENQATDRVHRIGQNRGVQVFKLVTKGTFEEKIHSMIERKAKLLEEVVGVDDQDVVKRLNRQDILELLQDVEITEAE